jgi:hypothetical protein
MSNPLAKLYKQMTQISWADLAGNSPKRSRSAGKTRKAASPVARGRSAEKAPSPRRLRSASPAAHPEDGDLEEFDGVWKQYHGKSKRWEVVKVYDAEQGYGGPYTDPMKLFEQSKFRSDMEDIYGDEWFEKAAEDNGIDARKIQEIPEYIEHLRSKYGLTAAATKAEILEAARKARRAAKVAAKGAAGKGGGRRRQRTYKGGKGSRKERKGSRKSTRRH